MFAKLLKHEWRATRGIVGLLCAIILVSGIMIGGVMNYMIGWEIDNGDMIVVNESEAAAMDVEPMSDFAAIMCALLLSAGIIAVAVCCAASLFYVIYRFYKRCFTDEGYLTFTLPVTHHQLLLSSYLNSVLSVLLVILAAFGAIAIASVLFLLAIPQNIVWADVWASTQSVLNQLRTSLVKNAGTFARLGFSAAISFLSTFIVLMLAVTVGSLIAKKHKILAAVAVYYGISFVQSLIFSMLSLGTLALQDADLFLTVPGVMSLIIAVAGYFLMHRLTSRKLNLV